MCKEEGVKKGTCVWWFSQRTSQKKFLFTLCLFWTMSCDLCTEPLYAIAIEIGSTSIASGSVITCEHSDILAGANWLEMNICKCALRSLGTKWLDLWFSAGWTAMQVLPHQLSVTGTRENWRLTLNICCLVFHHKPNGVCCWFSSSSGQVIAWEF